MVVNARLMNGVGSLKLFRFEEISDAVPSYLLLVLPVRLYS